MPSSSNGHAIAPIPAPVDRTAYYQTQNQRAYVVGDVAVDESDVAFGKDPTQFAPSGYGSYAATSVNVYAANRLLANKIGQLPLKAYKEGDNDDRQEQTASPLVDLLRRPNPWWTQRRWIRMIRWSLGLWGSSFTIKERDGRTVKELWWVRPDRMRVIVHPENYIAAFVYEQDGRTQAFPPEDVIWHRYENPIDEFAGLSPIAAARLSIDTDFDARRSNRNILRNGMRVSGLITPSGDQETFNQQQLEQIEGAVKQLYSGVSNAHKMAIFSKAANVGQLTLAPKDLEFLEQLRWSLGDVGRVYGIPPELLGDHTHATYSNIDQAYKGLWGDTARPEAEFIAEEIQLQLLPDFPNEADVIEFDFSGVQELQDDQQAVTLMAQRWFRMGVPLNRLLQEVAPHLLPPDGDGYEWGDEPLGIPEAAMSSTGPDAEADDPDVEEDDNPARLALRAWRERNRIQFGSAEHARRWRRFARRTEKSEREWIRQLEDYFRRQNEAVVARLTEQRSQRATEEVIDQPFDRESWEKRLRNILAPLMRDALEEGAVETLDDLNLNVAFDISDPMAQKWLKDRREKLIKDITNTTWNRVKQELAEGMEAGESPPQLVDRVQKQFDQARETRSKTIARTEVNTAQNAGSLEGARQSEMVEEKMWLSALDEATRESHAEAHGEAVGIDEDFYVGDGAGPAPGQLGAASEDINCRCTMTWVLKDGRTVASTVHSR